MQTFPRLAFLAAAFIFVTSAFSSSGALAQPAPRVKATKEAPTSPVVVTVRGGTGLGVFQDIQVPLNESMQRRSDGNLYGEENADHGGFPMMVGTSVAYRIGQLSVDILSFDALQMRATTGPAETQSSSYSRLQLATGISYGLPLSADWTGTASFDAGVRRSSFDNVSSAHFIEAAMVGGSLGLRSSSFGLNVFARTAPVARFGYSDAVVLGGHTFDGSTATLSEAGVLASFPIGPRVFLDTGFEQEMAHVTVSDLREYEQFGLGVDDPTRPTRVYDLATSVLRIGFRKEF